MSTINESWLNTVKADNSLEVETRSMKAKMNAKKLEKLLETLPSKSGGGYIDQMKSINIYLKYLLSDVSVLSYYQEPSIYDSTELGAGGEEPMMETMVHRLKNGSFYIRCGLPQRTIKSLKSVDTHIGRYLEKDINEYFADNHICGPIFDRAVVKMVLHFGPEIKATQIPDPDNVSIKGILDALQMKIIKNDSLVDISFYIHGIRDEKKSYMELLISERKEQ